VLNQASRNVREGLRESANPYRISSVLLKPDYSVFDCGGVALSEDKLSFSWEGDRSGRERVGNSEVIQ